MLKTIKTAIYEAWCKFGEIAALLAPLPLVRPLRLPTISEIFPAQPPTDDDAIKTDPCASWHDWPMPCELSGKKGDCKKAIFSPKNRFRSDKIIAIEMKGGKQFDGFGTKITSMIVGNRNQMGLDSGALTAFFSTGVIGNGFRFDICEPQQTIEFEVLFLKDCDLYITLFGKTDKLPAVEKSKTASA